MNLGRTPTRLAAWAGLWATALLWAVNMAAGQLLPMVDCTHRPHASALISAVFAVLALIAGLISWLAARNRPTGFGSPETLQFDAMLSALGSLIFVFALALQTTASLVLTGCER